MTSIYCKASLPLLVSKFSRQLLCWFTRDTVHATVILMIGQCILICEYLAHAIIHRGCGHSGLRKSAVRAVSVCGVRLTWIQQVLARVSSRIDLAHELLFDHVIELFPAIWSAFGATHTYSVQIFNGITTDESYIAVTVPRIELRLQHLVQV